MPTYNFLLLELSYEYQNRKIIVGNYSAPPMGMSNRLTVVLQQELH